MTPLSPLVRLRFGSILARRYGLAPDKAMETANELMVLLRKANLDIVLDTWVNDVGKEEKRTDESFWAGVQKLHQETEGSDYTPWKP